MKERKKIIIKTRTLHERKAHTKTKGKFFEFLDKEKVDISEFWGQNEVFFNPGSY